MSDSEREASKTKKKSNGSSASFSINRKVLLSALGVITVLGIGAAVFALVVPTKLESTHAQCVGENPRFAEFSALDDDGKGLFVDGAGDKSVGLVISDLACVIKNVEVPDSVISRMDNTTALMGQQEATFDGITLRWSYHPNNGLDMSFEMD